MVVVEEVVEVATILAAAQAYEIVVAERAQKGPGVSMDLKGQNAQPRSSGLDMTLAQEMM